MVFIPAAIYDGGIAALKNSNRKRGHLGDFPFWDVMSEPYNSKVSVCSVDEGVRALSLNCPNFAQNVIL